MVGERGAEMVALPGGSFVYTAEQTQKMLAQWGMGPRLGDIDVLPMGGAGAAPGGTTAVPLPRGGTGTRTYYITQDIHFGPTTVTTKADVDRIVERFKAVMEKWGESLPVAAAEHIADQVERGLELRGARVFEV
jgi:hypothetical protein